MPNPANEPQRPLTNIADDIESVLEDIFLSGFSGVRPYTTERIASLSQCCLDYGMEEAAALLEQLQACLKERRDSFESDSSPAMAAFARLEFYLEHFRSRIDQE